MLCSSPSLSLIALDSRLGRHGKIRVHREGRSSQFKPAFCCHVHDSQNEEAGLLSPERKVISIREQKRGANQDAPTPSWPPHSRPHEATPRICLASKIWCETGEVESNVNDAERWPHNTDENEKRKYYQSARDPIMDCTITCLVKESGSLNFFLKKMHTYVKKNWAYQLSNSMRRTIKRVSVYDNSRRANTARAHCSPT